MGILKQLAVKAYRIVNPPNIFWKGEYPSWEAALGACGGYDADAIIETVANAARAVKNGKATYERDGMLFYTTDYNWQLLYLLQKAARNRTQLTVLDFGGALASQYFQNKALFPAIPVTWVIVEQPKFVAIGRNEFETESLKFEFSLEEALQKYAVDVCLFSSVLHYLENPKVFTAAVNAARVPWIYVDRTAFSSREQIAVQHITRYVYEGSYPTRFFKEGTLPAYFPDYNVLATFRSDQEPDITLNGVPVFWQGFIFEVKN